MTDRKPREYIADLRARCKAALKHGELLDFYDVLAISRPTGEQAIFWLLPALRDEQTENAALRKALAKVHNAVTTATAYPEAVKHIHELIDEVLK